MNRLGAAGGSMLLGWKGQWMMDLIRVGAASLVVGALLVAGGCAIIGGPSVGGTLSENLALSDYGAVANVAAFNDGNKYTSARTRPAITNPDDPNWMEAEKYTVGLITFPEVTPIHKIKVYSKDLDRNLSVGMTITVDYMKPTGEWRTIRTWDRSPIPRDPVVNTEVEGKAVRLRIKRPQTLFSGGGRGGSSTDNGERTLYEFEVYKYIPDDEDASPPPMVVPTQTSTPSPM